MYNLCFYNFSMYFSVSVYTHKHSFLMWIPLSAHLWWEMRGIALKHFAMLFHLQYAFHIISDDYVESISFISDHSKVFPHVSHLQLVYPAPSWWAFGLYPMFHSMHCIAMSHNIIFTYKWGNWGSERRDYVMCSSSHSPQVIVKTGSLSTALSAKRIFASQYFIKQARGSNNN